MNRFDHINIDRSHGVAECSACSLGLSMSPDSIYTPHMLDAFEVLHSVHDKQGKAVGLTKTGRPTKAAKEAIREAGDA